MLSLLPFLFERELENDLRFSLAVGSIGGLMMSVIAYTFVMPIFLGLKSEKH